MQDLLLLHGALGHTLHFAPYLDWLKQYFKVHTILFDGHGGTGIPADGIRMEHYVTQLHGYCEKHQLEQFHVFGYSMGGYIALAYALQQPGKIASILTLATKLHWTAEGAAKESKMLDPGVIAEKVPKYAAQLEQLHGPGWKDLLPAIAGMMTALGAHPLLDATRYARMATRVQLMVGDKDVMASIDETLEAAKMIPDARFAVLPATKHPLEQVRADLLMALMKDFWAL